MKKLLGLLVICLLCVTFSSTIKADASGITRNGDDVSIHAVLNYYDQKNFHILSNSGAYLDEDVIFDWKLLHSDDGYGMMYISGNVTFPYDYKYDCNGKHSPLLYEDIYHYGNLNGICFDEGVTNIPENLFEGVIRNPDGTQEGHWWRNLNFVFLPKSMTYISPDVVGRIFSKNYTTLYVYKDSYAHRFCEEYGFDYDFCLTQPTVTAPKAITGLTYDGTAHTLIKRGSTNGGTLKYSLSEYGTYSTSLPKATKAGTYKVYYKVESDGVYDSTNPKYITVKIAKIAPVVTAPKAKTLSCTGSAQKLVTAGTTSGGTLKYSLSATGTYSTTIPTATKPGTYKVYYKVAGGTNYTNTSAKYVTSKITLKKPVISAYSNKNSGIKIAWGKVPGATGYYVYRGTTQIKTITSGSTVSYIDTAVKSKLNASSYTYYVYAYYKNSAGTIIKSAKSAGKITYRMKAPTDITLLTSTGVARVNIDPKPNGVGYIIYRSKDGGRTYEKIGSILTYTYRNTGLISGKRYYYKVKTYKTINGVKVYSDFSVTKSIVVK